MRLPCGADEQAGWLWQMMMRCGASLPVLMWIKRLTGNGKHRGYALRTRLLPLWGRREAASRSFANCTENVMPGSTVRGPGAMFGVAGNECLGDLAGLHRNCAGRGMWLVVVGISLGALLSKARRNV